MYYYQVGTTLTEISIDEANAQPSGLVAVLNSADWEKVKSRWTFDIPLPAPFHHTRFCKAEVFSGCLCGTFSIPKKNAEKSRKNFFYCMKKDQILFVDDTNTAHACIEKILQMNTSQEGGLGHFFYDFLERLIENDLIYLEELEDRIAKLEDAIFNGMLENINHKMLPFRKEALSFYRYYSQLIDLGQELIENENGFFQEEVLLFFKRFTDRVTRLQGETQMLREYAMQVQEAYQAQMDIRQNKIMKTLTIVTTIFLPLSLIAGWYGMNFTNMPELSWRYGYPLIMIISILIVLICMSIFKKKKYW